MPQIPVFTQTVARHMHERISLNDEFQASANTKEVSALHKGLQA
jgi:hypothetical protein